MVTLLYKSIKPGIICLAIFVVGLGAYTRLSDSGLGCPDWPACYGHWYVQKTIHFPHLSLLDTYKAWTEMIHRYIAGCLGLLIIATLTIESYSKKQQGQNIPWTYYITLGLLVLQALFGMWTVTWKLHPLAVMPHLLGGMTLTLLISWVFSSPEKTLDSKLPPQIIRIIWLLFTVICGQVVLGGWTSANYAALVCPDFPTCQGKWIPDMQFFEAFSIPPIGPNYDGGALSGAARTAIHVSHRVGGLIAACITCYLGVICYQNLYRLSTSTLRYIIVCIICVSTQIILGIANVLYLLPISIAVAHNVGALIILLVLARILVNHYRAIAPINPQHHLAIT